jgi:hypothetical protein
MSHDLLPLFTNWEIFKIFFVGGSGSSSSSSSISILYNLKLSRRLNSIKFSRAHSRVNWLQVETDVSGTISVPIIRVVM